MMSDPRGSVGCSRRSTANPRRDGVGGPAHSGRRYLPVFGPALVCWSGRGRTQETWVIMWSMAAKDSEAEVANRGVLLAGKVAIVASPTMKTSKSFARFRYPAVV